MKYNAIAIHVDIKFVILLSVAIKSRIDTLMAQYIIVQRIEYNWKLSSFFNLHYKKIIGWAWSHWHKDKNDSVCSFIVL